MGRMGRMRPIGRAPERAEPALERSLGVAHDHHVPYLRAEDVQEEAGVEGHLLDIEAVAQGREPLLRHHAILHELLARPHLHGGQRALPARTRTSGARPVWGIVGRGGAHQGGGW